MLSVHRELEPYEGAFAHGISLDDWSATWNISITGHLMSPDFMALANGGLREAHTSLRDAPLEAIRDAAHLIIGVPTPRARNAVYIASMLRAGVPLYDGYGIPVEMPAEERDRIIRMGDIELEFESARRELSPEAPSRLTCLYLADDSRHGRATSRTCFRHVA